MFMPPPVHVGASSSLRLGPQRGDTACVSFNVCVETRWGDTVVITGSSEQLGGWAPERGLRLSTDKQTYPVWRCSEPLVMSRLDVEYKVVIMRAPDATPEWEPLDDNRVLPLTRLESQVTVAIGWGKLSSSPTARRAHMRAPLPPPPPVPAPYHTGLTPPLRPVSLADAPRRRRSSAPALHYQPRGGSVGSGTGRQNSNSNSPCAGPEFPDAVVCDPCALPPSLLNCPPALGNSPIVGELAAGAPHIFKGAPHPHTVGCGHSYGHSYVSGPAGGGGGGSGFYASSGLYACPGTAAAGADPRLPLRMLNFGEPLNAIMSMDQSWPPSLGSSIDMHGSNGVLEQAAGSQKSFSKESGLGEIMASVGEGEEAGADDAGVISSGTGMISSGANGAAPDAAGAVQPPWPARRVRPASASSSASPSASSPSALLAGGEARAGRDARGDLGGVLGGVMRAQGNPAAAALRAAPPPAGAATAGQGVQVMPPACNSFSIPSAAAAASPSASNDARREQLRRQLQQRPALPASVPTSASTLPTSAPALPAEQASATTGHRPLS